MKNYSKKFIIPVLGVAVLGAGLYGVTKVSADSTAGQPKSLVQEIADAFHLDKTKVQAVFDRHRGEEQAFHETKYEDRLAKAVTDGKITAAQKEAILAEHQKLESEMKAAMDKTGQTRAERKTAMDKIRQEAEDWAKQNNVDTKWLMVGGHGRGFGMRMHGGGEMGLGEMPPAQDQ